MKLFLVQHGDALSKEIDPERPLSETGRGDVERLGAFLKRADIRVSGVWHSGERRAEQTAALLDAALGGWGCRPANGLAPNDDVKAFAAMLRGGPEDVLVVGHLPFMARLVGLLVCGDPEREVVTYRPGSVVCLESGDSDAWIIQWMLRPELMPPSAGL